MSTAIKKLFLLGLVLLGGVGTAMAEPMQWHAAAIEPLQHVTNYFANVEWHAAAIGAAVKYLDMQSVAERYAINVRSVLRRVREGLLPKPKYFGTRFPRWDIAELDENDRRLAAVRITNPGVIAAIAAAKKKRAAEAKAAKSSESEPKPAARPRGRPRRAAAAEEMTP